MPEEVYLKKFAVYVFGRCAGNVNGLFYAIGNFLPYCIKTLREDRTAAERKMRLRDPPQAENPAEQDSFLRYRKILRSRILFNLTGKTLPHIIFSL